MYIFSGVIAFMVLVLAGYIYTVYTFLHMLHEDEE